MKNKIWIALVLGLLLGALIANLRAVKKIHVMTTAAAVADPSTDLERAQQRAVVDDTVKLEDVQRRLHEIDERLDAVAAGLAGLQRQSANGATVNNRSLAEMDADLDALAKSAAKNAQDIQRLSGQEQGLVQQTQAAFTAIAQQLGSLDSTKQPAAK